jgi:hypothetical protein
MTWLLAILSLAGNELVIRKLRSGFAVRMVANAGLVVHFWLVSDWALVALYVVFWLMAFRGWWKWKE